VSIVQVPVLLVVSRWILHRVPLQSNSRLPNTYIPLLRCCCFRRHSNVGQANSYLSTTMADSGQPNKPSLKHHSW
jgi:hypothetical protein